MEYERIMFIGGPNHGERKGVMKGVPRVDVCRRVTSAASLDQLEPFELAPVVAAMLAALERAGYVLLPVAPTRIADMGDADVPPVRKSGDVVG